MKLGRSQIQKGVHLLPSLLTLGNLCCGFYVIREASDGRFERAALFIAISIVLDGLDGKLARLANATSPMGIQLDSLADIVSFGVAPALLAYSWALEGLGRQGWAIAFLFTSCGAIRLARFNVSAGGEGDPRFFQGLPIPAAAGMVGSTVFLFPERVEGAASILVGLGVVVLALLMVSSIKYRSFKQGEVTRRRPYRMLLWVAGAFTLISWHPQATLVSGALAYTLSGPLARALTLLRKSTSRPSIPDDEAEASGDDEGADSSAGKAE